MLGVCVWGAAMRASAHCRHRGIFLSETPIKKKKQQNKNKNSGLSFLGFVQSTKQNGRTLGLPRNMFSANYGKKPLAGTKPSSQASHKPTGEPDAFFCLKPTAAPRVHRGADFFGGFSSAKRQVSVSLEMFSRADVDANGLLEGRGMGFLARRCSRGPRRLLVELRGKR